MTEEITKVSVLGLGRMGGALARRLAARGRAVTGWSRGGTAVDGVAVTSGPAGAVEGADVVVLALYDAEACHDVLGRCLERVPPDGVVMNTSTVAPDEADALHALVRRSGRRYLHAPLVGSVPAAATGGLTVLAGDRRPPDTAADVLRDLGEVVHCADAVTAASLKLLANGVLADGLVAVGQGIARGRRLNLEPAAVLDTLQRTPVGGLVAAKRAWLEGSDRPAHFSAGALGKDLRLLSGLEPAARALRQTVETADAPADADIAAISAGLAAADGRLIDERSNLYARLGTSTDPRLLAPLIGYARGHADGDSGHFRAAFRPTAHVEGLRDGAFVSWNLDDYCSVFTGRPADDEPSRSRTLTELRSSGTVAHATMVLEHGPDTFTDMFVLVREGDAWLIANKVYHRQPAR